MPTFAEQVERLRNFQIENTRVFHGGVDVVVALAKPYVLKNSDDQDDDDDNINNDGDNDNDNVGVKDEDIENNNDNDDDNDDANNTHITTDAVDDDHLEARAGDDDDNHDGQRTPRYDDGDDDDEANIVEAWHAVHEFAVSSPKLSERNVSDQKLTES